MWLYIHIMFKFVDDETERRIRVWFICHETHLKRCLCRNCWFVGSGIYLDNNILMIYTACIKVCYYFKSSDLPFPLIFLYRCLKILHHSHRKTLKTFVHVVHLDSMQFIGQTCHIELVIYVCNIFGFDVGYDIFINRDGIPFQTMGKTFFVVGS